MTTITVQVPFKVKKKKPFTMDEVFTLYGRYLQQQTQELENYELDFWPDGINAKELLARMEEIDNE